MKIRKGLVSNSSASSFIVSSKEKTVGEIEITLDINLDEFVSDKVSTEEDLVKYMIKNYYCDSIDELGEHGTKIYNKALGEIRKGRTVHFGQFSSDGDEEGERFLCRKGLNSLNIDSSINIIEGDGGY